MNDIATTLAERGSRYGNFADQGRIEQNIKRAMHDSPNWAFAAGRQQVRAGNDRHEGQPYPQGRSGIRRQLARHRRLRHADSEQAGAVIHLLVIFLAGYGSVFLLGFQSRCVNHGNPWLAACCSFVIATTQTTLWGALFHDHSWSAAIAYGLSGSAAITSSMYVHRRLAKPKDVSAKELQLTALALLERAKRMR
jgi:hypothetical protein